MSKQLIQLINSDAMKAQFQKTMNSPKMLDRFIRLATSAINQTPRLAECTTQSIVGALLKSAQLNLEPNTIMGHCYLIPRKSKGQWECNFELGYKGNMELARRSDEIGLIEAREIHEFDEFDADYGENKLTHKPNWKGDRGQVIGYWARYRMKNDPSQAHFEIMTRSDVEMHRDKYSKSAASDYSPWNTAFDQMAKKTVIKKVLAYAPISVEDYQHAMAADATVINADIPGHSLPVSTADLLKSAPAIEIEAEELPAEEPESVKVIAPIAPAVIDNTEEQHRLETLAKLKQKIAASGLDQAEIITRLAMPMSMIEKQPTAELLKLYKKVPG